MQDKNVLIIADVFPPGFAPRMGYLSKYLSDHAWKGIAVSCIYDSEQNVFGFLSGYICSKIIVISKKNEHKYKKNFIQKALSFFIPDLRPPWRLNREMMQQCKKLINTKHIDIILCSTSSIFPLNVAYKIAKFHDIPWIADLRDVDEQYPDQGSFLMKLYRKIGIRRRNYLLRKANAITVVSKKHVELFFQYKLNAQLIYNGFDSELFKPSTFHQLDIFRIVYTGTIFSSWAVGRNPSPLFSAIQKLHSNGSIDPKNCRVQFYTNSKSQEIIDNLAKKYDVIDFVDCFKYVSSTEMPKVLDDSSILLLLIQGNTGIMTTKFFEYLGVGRPILCIWSDEGNVENIIRTSNAGIAAKNEEDIYMFIKMKYDEWLKTGYTSSDINQDFVMQFTRKANAKQFVELFEFVLRDRK